MIFQHDPNLVDEVVEDVLLLDRQRAPLRQREFWKVATKFLKEKNVLLNLSLE